MTSLDQATLTQLKNIETRTGKTLAELAKVVKGSGLEKHGELRDMLMTNVGMGHGDANTFLHYLKQSESGGSGASPDQAIDEIYSGPKAELRPIHDALMQAINKFGDFEIAPKKGYISLRRKKQFAMIGPGTKTRVDLGINAKGLEATDRLLALPPGGMCQYQVRLTNVSEVTPAVIGWVKTAYDAAG